MQSNHKYNPPQVSPLNIIYCDDDILLVDKPSGLLSVPGRGSEKQDCLAKRLLVDFPDVLIVHRLDMETSGIILLARNKLAHKQLSQQFEQRRVSKQYQAIVNGVVEEQYGTIELPLIADWPNRPRQMVNLAKGKKSITHYFVQKRNREINSTHVLLTPVTGRSHQLRLHMQSIGHSIMGDRLYSNSVERQQDLRLMLHASSIEFSHPSTSQHLGYSCPAPF